VKTRLSNDELFYFSCQSWELGGLAIAFRGFLHLAKNNDISSQLNLAFFYSQGLHVRKNRRREEYWLRNAGELGSCDALWALAKNAERRRKFAMTRVFAQRALGLGSGEAAAFIAAHELRSGRCELALQICERAQANFVLTEESAERIAAILKQIASSPAKGRSGRGDGIASVTPPTPPDMRFSASGG